MLLLYFCSYFQQVIFRLRIKMYNLYQPNMDHNKLVTIIVVCKHKGQCVTKIFSTYLFVRLEIGLK